MGKWLMTGTLLLGGILAWVVVLLFLGSLGEPTGSSEFVLESLPVYALGGWTALYLCVAVFVVVDAVRKTRRDDLAGLRTATMVVKLGNIPFFVGNFVLLFLISAVLSVAHGAGLVLAPFLVVWTYLVMLPTSAYGFALVRVMVKQQAMPAGTAFLHVLLHLVFVVDVVSTVVVSVKARSVMAGRRPSGPVWIGPTVAG